jgi:F-type H+-transporting ATPase subunit b
MATETHTESGDGLHTGTEALHAEEKAFPPFNPEFFASQLLWLAICFVAFYYIVKKLALPRIGGILEVRRDRIASDLDNAQRLKEQSDDAIAGYEQALTAARQKAYGIAEEARAGAAKASDAKRATSEADLNEKLAAAERRIADIKTRALGEVNGIATDTAETVIETLLGSKAPRDEVEGAVARVAKE